MRWSVRSTLLAVVMPLTIGTVTLATVQVADLVAARREIAELRDSAFRLLLVERYARSIQVLLQVSHGQLEARGEGLEIIASAHSRTVETLERLDPFVNDSLDPEAGLTRETLHEWESTQEQLDQYIEQAANLVRRGERVRARRLLDELGLLVRSRIFSSLDRITQHELERIEEYRVRVTRTTQHWLARYAGPLDLRRQLLPDFYETILAERFARHAYAELESVSRVVLAGESRDTSHGIAAGHALAQLERLSQERIAAAVAHGENGTGEEDVESLSTTYALVRNAYARTLALPAGSLGAVGRSSLDRVGEVFDQSVLPLTEAIVQAREHSIESEFARFDRRARNILALSVGIAAMALVLGLGSPWVLSRLILRPIADLVATVSSFRGGEKSARPTLRPRNELGMLSQSLAGLLDEFQETDQKMRSLALYDSMTDLPNRKFFLERLAGAMVTASLQGRAMALITVNVASLKQINETLGVGAGDDLIRQAGARLRECVRMSDIVSRSGDKQRAEVSHLGGDEFTLLLTQLGKPDDASFVAQRVLARISETFRVAARDVSVEASIGIAVYPQDADDADTLLRNATAAMHQAKKEGSSLYRFYSEEMNVANSRKLHIQNRLRGAIERDELTLEYQPIRNAEHGGLTGAEALVRWTDSEMGPVGPSEFMPISEHAGLVSQIGRWVLFAACRQLQTWREAGYRDFRVSINVSATQLRDEAFPDIVATALKETGVSPAWVELEITETTMLHEGPATIAAMTKLTQLGVGIVLDDFGTGYSSLSNLRHLPISRLKLDRSFVSEVSEDGTGGGLAAAIIALARGLNLEVVAEGIETHDQANFVRNCGCQELQGYLISRALPAAQFERFLEREKEN